MIAPVQSHEQTEMDAMDTIVLSTCDAWRTIQLLCRELFTLHVAFQLPPYESVSMLDQRCTSEHAFQGP